MFAWRRKIERAIQAEQIMQAGGCRETRKFEECGY